MSHSPQDLVRTTLSVLFIGSLIVSSCWIMWPFLPAIIWAVTLVVATWPLMLRVQHGVGNRRSLAVLIMTTGLLLLLVVPLWLAISIVVANMDEITEWIRNIRSLHMPPPPAWITDLPILGTRISQTWSHLTSGGMSEVAPKLAPYAAGLAKWFIAIAGSVGGIFVQFLLTVAIAAAMYASGERAAAIALRFGLRLGGERGEMTVRLAGRAIRGVALGVVVTAVVQCLLGGIGLAACGVPFAGVLTALMFILCLAQLGPGLVLIPAVVWKYYSSSTTSDMLWATVLLVFALVAMTLDNFLRPLLIRRGADLPLPLILAGVIGGLIAMGLLGIFLGPVVLAIAYTLLNAWMSEGYEPNPSAAKKSLAE